mmetsp:Transcript_31075/g.39822  ORF Transcript_31075/g.39822 Transcript_31075/m.39822 type:complete len:105 (+) Transcript_31075:287-601(+)
MEYEHAMATNYPMSKQLAKVKDENSHFRLNQISLKEQSPPIRKKSMKKSLIKLLNQYRNSTEKEEEEEEGKKKKKTAAGKHPAVISHSKLFNFRKNRESRCLLP